MVGVLRDRALPERPDALGRARPSRGQPGERHPRRAAAAGHVGHADASISPSTPSTTSARARTGARASSTRCMKSPMWKDTAIFLTWDDWGGFYDHVPPVRLDDFGFGIRVPLLVISPYALQGVVDHRAGRVLQRACASSRTNWNLSTLTARDAGGGDLSGGVRLHAGTPAAGPPTGHRVPFRRVDSPATTCPFVDRSPDRSSSASPLLLALAVARGGLHERIGRSALLDVRGRVALRDHVADQARRLPHQGEPELRQHVRARSPAANGATVGERPRRRRRPLTPATDQRAHDLTHCYNCALAAVDDGKMDGFNQSASRTTTYAFTQIRAGRSCRTTGTGPQQQRAVRTTSSRARRARRSRTTCTRSPRTSGGALDNPVQTFQALQHQQEQGLAKSWGCDIAAARRLRRGASTPRATLMKVDPCFDFQTEGDLLNEAGHPVGVLRGHEHADRLHLVGVLGDRALPRRPRDVGRSTSVPVDDVVARHRGRPAAAGHVDHAAVPAVRAPRVQLLPRRELDHAGRQRDHEQPHVEGHRDLHHVGRLRRLLRPRAAASRSTTSASASASRCWSSARTRSEGTVESRARRVLERPAVHRGQLGPHLSSRTGTGDATPTGLTTFDFSQAPRQPDPLPLRTDCEGPIWSPPLPDPPAGELGLPDPRPADLNPPRGIVGRCEEVIARLLRIERVDS